METIRIYHPGLDVYADVPLSAFGQHVRQGWVEAEDEPQPEPEPVPKKTAAKTAAKKTASSAESAGTKEEGK